MDPFRPIDMAIARPQARFLYDPETNRPPRQQLAALSRHHTNHDRPHSWGFTIFGTVYSPGSDEAFARAIERLLAYGTHFANDDILLRPLANMEPRDPAPNAHLISRFYNDVIEDESNLSGASVEQVGERFDAWVQEHLNAGEPANARYIACLMIDQESLHNILQLPQDPKRSLRHDRQKYDRWVKVVANWQRPVEQGGRYWLRVGICDRLWAFWFGLDENNVSMFGVDDGDGVMNHWGRDRHR